MNRVPTEYEQLAHAASPRGDVVLRKRRRDSAAPVIELRVNGVFVMDTAETSTEEALASAALGLVESPHRVLVGGLGLGFTLQAVLADPRVGTVTVVEIEEPVVAWMRGAALTPYLAALGDDAEAFVAEYAARVESAYPRRGDGLVLFPFARVFIIAQRGA